MVDGLQLDMRGLLAHAEARTAHLRLRLEHDGAKAVESQMRSVHARIVTTSPVDMGRLRRSWPPPTSRGTPLAWGTGTHLHYAPTLEYGGYKGVGPRTVQLGGGDLVAGFVAGAGIYSRQAPLGFVRRALAEAAPQTMLRMQTLLRRQWGA